MTDTMIKGSGNSRKLITVPNAPTLYPDHATLMQKWASEGIPVDIGPLLAIGCDVIGTLLNKANVLPDSVEKELWGDAANRTPAQALEKIWNTADGRLRAETGSYKGTGDRYSARINLSFDAKLVFVHGTTNSTHLGAAIALKGVRSSILFAQVTGYPADVRIDQTGSFYSGYVNLPGDVNYADTTYYYIAIG